MPLENNSTYYNIKTPEGIAVALPVAGLWSRSAAWLIDLLIRAGIYITLAITLSIAGLFGKGLLIISFFILEWFYPVIYEVLNSGMTPGKKIIGIRVMTTQGVNVDWSTSMTRNLLRFIDMLPFIYGVGFVSLLVSKYCQRIGDYVAGTIVIYNDEIESYALEKDLNDASDTHSHFSQINRLLTHTERQAFIEYAERAEGLSQDRKTELVSLLRSVFNAYDLNLTVETLDKFSRYIVDTHEAI